MPVMVRRSLILVATAVLASFSGPACGVAEPPPPSQEEAEPQAEPEKKPDAFQYFFGRKEAKEKKGPEEGQAAEAPAEPAPEAAARPAEIPKMEAATPETPPPEVRPEPTPQPDTTPKEPQVDAFEYFFGRTRAEPESTKDSAARQPVDAFEYFFGKNGRAGSIEEEPASPPPP